MLVQTHSFALRFYLNLYASLTDASFSPEFEDDTSLHRSYLSELVANFHFLLVFVLIFCCVCRCVSVSISLTSADEHGT